MADRSVKVALKAEVAGFVAGLQTAKAEVKSFSTGLQQDAVKHKQAWTEVGAGFAAVGALGVGAFALAANAAMGFDKEMSNVKAATSATGQSFDDLRAAAIQAGKDTAFSAGEAAQAETELAKAGVSVKDILGGGLKGALALAAAGQIDVADAAAYASTTMTQFGLAGKDVPHIADLLAAAANKAQGEVGDFALAMKYVGPVAHQLGISLEETTGTLAELASNGILADQAGTSLRGMLTALTSPSKIAAGAMKDLGINVYDAQGNFVGFRGVAEELRSKLKDLTNEQRDQALGQIFGNEQITAARILYAGGADAVDKWTKSVDANGYATDVAATKMDNLSGDVEQLKGSLETALIESGSKANGLLRDMTQAATGTVNAFINLPGPVQGAATALGGLGGVVSLAAGAFFLGAPKVAAFKNSLADLGPRAERLGGLLGRAGGIVAGPWGLAIGAGITVLGLYAKKHEEANQRVKALAETLDQQTGAVTKDTEAWVAQRLQQEGVLSAAEKIGVSLSTVTQAALGNADAQATLNAALDEQESILKNSTVGTSNDESYQRVKAVNAVKDAVSGQNGELQTAVERQKQMAEALKDDGKAAENTKPKVTDFAGAIKDTGKSADEASLSVSDFKKAIDGLASPTADIRKAQRDWQAAIDDTTKSLKDNGHNLDIGTEKGRSNQAALDSLAASARDLTGANYENGASQEALQKQVDGARGEFVKLATQMGMSKAEAQKLAERLITLPGVEKPVAPKIDKGSIDTASAAAQGVANKLGAINGITAAPKVDTRPIDLARDRAQAVFDRLAALDGFTAHAHIDISVTQGITNKLNAMGLAGARAAGGPVVAGRSYLVGEEGPEVFTPTASGMVTSNAALRQAQPQPLQYVQGPSMPSELVVRDVDGALIGRMRVEAAGAVDRTFGNVKQMARVR